MAALETISSISPGRKHRGLGWWVGLSLFWAALAGPGLAQAPAAQPSGIVVESVEQGSVAAKAGLAPGDILLSWRRDAAAGGLLSSPFDLVQVAIEQVPRGAVSLLGRRGSAERAWSLPGGSVSRGEGLETAPVFADDAEARYRTGRERLAAGDLEVGLAAWHQAIETLRAAGHERPAAWLEAEEARALARAGRWEDADAVYRRILPPLEANPHGDPAAAQLLREWGALFQDRYDWDQQADCYQRALAVDRKVAPESLAAAWSLIGLGYADNLSGGSKDDSAFFEEALRIRQHLAPGSSAVANAWLEWGNAARLDSDFPRAVERYHWALAILGPLPGGSLESLEVLNMLAYTHYLAGRTREAEDAWQRAVTVADREAPDDFRGVGSLQGLGLLLAKRKDWPQAERLLHRALDLCQRLKPGSLLEADAWYDLGRVERQAGKLELGAEALCRSQELLESWRRKFEGIEAVRMRWGLFFADRYHECAESRLEINQPERAYQSVEDGRARAFLNLLAEHQLRQARLSAPEAAEWRDLDAEYERVEVSLRRLEERAGRSPDAATWNLEGRLREIRRRKDALLRGGGSWRSLSYPAALSLAETRRQLDPGTVLLSYSTGAEKTLLFAVAAADAGEPGWRAFALDVGAAELKRRVDAFRALLVDDRTNGDEIARQGQALYDLLVRPAEPLVGVARQLLISPDGPLHVLPFAALQRNGRFLAEEKPLHFALSATAYAEIRKERRAPADRPRRLVAFGDPLYPPSARPAPQADERTREAVRRGFTPLPSTRQEVGELAELFPGARIFLGRDVTERAVQEAVGGASLIHFAVHGLLNERVPLNSALVLSLPSDPQSERGNGLLQAWEVMENLPLDADLVTLSACDTGLGGEMGGEGLIGLTRAFQYAGARSVLATLWGISDSTTADFMKHFYTALRDGKNKTEALQAAQVAQIHSAKPQPFYWAAFQLYGDWK